MPTWLLIAIILIVGCGVSVYVTASLLNKEFMSEWLIIKLKNNSVEPIDIFICKNCHIREEDNYRYCKNCGRRMRNGKGSVWSYPEDIEI